MERPPMLKLIYQKHCLTQSDAIRLAVSPGILNEVPPFGQGTHFQYLIFNDLEERDRLWFFRLARRRHGYPKPTISGEWRNFVESKGLGPGNGVMFFKEENGAAGGPTYWVQPFYRRI